MEKEITRAITEYINANKLSLDLNINEEYKKIILKTKDIVLDAELLKVIVLNTKYEKKDDYDYFYYITPSCKYYISGNAQEINDLDLNFTYLLNKYQENKSSIYKYISILKELVMSKKIDVKGPSFYKYNTDEAKIFSKFLLESINKKEEINFEKFIYFKYYDYQKVLDIKQKNLFPSNAKELKIVKLINNFEEILNIFDEIYDIKLINNLRGDIVEIDTIKDNKLFFNETLNEKEKGTEFIIQIYVTKDVFKEIVMLIKKIKNFDKNIKITLYVNEIFEDFYILFKEGLICNLVVKNPVNKNLLMLKDNKDLFIHYDNENKISSEIVISQMNDIKKIMPDYFECLYLLFNVDNKFHKIKITLDLSCFIYLIKDKAYQNYFTLNEYNEEKKYYSIYLYSKNNRLSYDIFAIENPTISAILQHWLNYGNKKCIDKVDSLILVNGYDLMLKSAKIPVKQYYNKIIMQIDIYDKNEEFYNALEIKHIEFHTRNIYFVKDLNDYIDDNKIIPTTSLKTYIKRGFNNLVPFFSYMIRKQPILNKKPIIVQISYFLSYNLNVYGIDNELDK